MILLSLISEIVACIMTIISPVIENKTIFAFVIAGIIKVVLLITLDMDKDFKTVLTSTVISFVFYIGIILKIVLNIPSNQLYKEVALAAVGILTGAIACKILYNSENKILRNSKAGIISVIYVISLIAVMILLFRIFNSENGDGSIEISSVTFQLPEAIKILFVVETYMTGTLMTRNKNNIIYFYITSLATTLTLFVVFKEFGTVLISVYYTLSMAIVLSHTKKFKAQSHNKVLRVVSLGTTPYILGTIFFICVKITKNILYKMYPIRGAIGEELYGQDNRLFYLSERLWADAPQTVEARNIIKGTHYIQLNLNPDIQIPNCRPETAISDYCIVVLAQGFGKYVSVALIIGIIALLIYIFFKSDYLGKSASLMLISQIAVQIFGIMGFCFTGINIPFISTGASSMFSSFVLITFIICSMRRKNNA